MRNSPRRRRCKTGRVRESEQLGEIVKTRRALRRPCAHAPPHEGGVHDDEPVRSEMPGYRGRGRRLDLTVTGNENAAARAYGKTPRIGKAKRNRRLRLRGEGFGHHAII